MHRKLRSLLARNDKFKIQEIIEVGMVRSVEGEECEVEEDSQGSSEGLLRILCTLSTVFYLFVCTEEFTTSNF